MRSQVNVATSENAGRLLHTIMPHLGAFLGVPALAVLPVFVLFSLRDQIGTEKKKAKPGKKKRVGFEEQLIAQLAVGSGRLKALETDGEARSTFTDQVTAIAASLRGERTDQFQDRSKHVMRLEKRRQHLATGLELIVLVDETLSRIWSKNGPTDVKFKTNRICAFFKDIATRCGQATVPLPKFAIYATGYGGKVGIRAGLSGDRGVLGDDLPTVDAMERQLGALKALIQGEKAAGPTASVTFYRSYRYRTKENPEKTPSSKLMPKDEQMKARPDIFGGDVVMWRTDWMKPHPGALEQAMQDAGVWDPSKAVVIGSDTGVDREWADNAGGIDCYQATEFFGQFD